MEIKISKNPFLIVLIILIALNLLVWSIILLRRSSTKGDLLSPLFFKEEDEIDLPQFRLISFDGKKFISEKNLDANLNILIFFALEDCPVCLYEAEFWGKVSNSLNKEHVKFVGITSEKDIMKILRFCKEYGLTFPILYDREGRVRDKILSIREISRLNISTPFKIFAHSNRILQVEGPNKNLQKQSQLQKRVLELLKKCKNYYQNESH